MGPLSIAFLMISGICLAVGLLHLMIFFRRRDRMVELFFAVMAVAVGVSFIFETRLYTAVDLNQAVSAFKSMLTFQGITWMAFAWFIVLLAGATRRRLAFFVTRADSLRKGRFELVDGGRFFWTKSASCSWICSPSCCACCRRVNLNALAAPPP
jgi:hypothetical protein